MGHIHAKNYSEAPMSSDQPRSGVGRFIIIMVTLPMLHIAYSEAARAVVGVFMSVTLLLLL